MSIIENQNLINNNKNHNIREYWKNNNIILEKRLKNIPEINYSIY
jgi:hypothetical protein